MIQYLYYMRIIKIYEGYDDMKDTWNDWWEDFLERKRLRNIVAELNELDSQLGRENLTEKICKAIYDGYDGRDIELQKVKKALSELLGDLDEVHLQSSRIKKKASIPGCRAFASYGWRAIFGRDSNCILCRRR